MIDLNNGAGAAAFGPANSSLEQLLLEQVRDWMRGDCKPLKSYLERQRSLSAEEEERRNLAKRRTRGPQNDEGSGNA